MPQLRPAQAGQQAITQIGQVRCVSLQTRGCQFAGDAEADNRRDVLGAGAQAMLVATALDLRAQVEPLANQQRADALGAIELVRRQAQRIDVEVVKSQRALAGPLHGIGVDHRPSAARRLRQTRDVLHHASLVVRGDERSQHQPFAGLRCEFVTTDAPLRVKADVQQLPPFAHQTARRTPDAGVFAGAKGHSAGSQARRRAAHKQIVGF